jgi:hypothetical protein
MMSASGAEPCKYPYRLILSQFGVENRAVLPLFWGRTTRDLHSFSEKLCHLISMEMQCVLPVGVLDGVEDNS